MKIYVFCLILDIVILVSAHSHLGYPRPTRRLDCRVGNRRDRPCPGPCPPLDTYGEPTGYTASNPAVTWRRGEQRTVTWHRNNHGDGESGFVRLSMVPVNQVMNKNAHKRFTIQISCWSAGLHWCSSRNIHECGNDSEGKAYQVRITVPTSYPDGVYVFGWAWYGGGDHRGKSFFGDYYSCSFIRINGGDGPTAVWKPVFVPGANQKRTDACMSAANRVGVCPREPCHVGPVKPMYPTDLPSAIYRKDLDNGEGRCDSDNSESCGNVDQKPNKRTRLSFNVHGMKIIDVGTGNSRDTDGTRFSLKMSDYNQGFTLALRTSGRIGSVKFNVGKFSHTEYVAPYIINGNPGRLHGFNVCRKNRTVDIRVTVTGIRNSLEYRFEMKCI